MEFRRIFDTIPDQFDRWRPRYCAQAFADIAQEAHLGPGAAALEIGPGTGQATEPILRTGCDYLGVELGEHLAARMREKFADAPNFSLVCGDFLEQDLGRSGSTWCSRRRRFNGWTRKTRFRAAMRC